MKALTLLKPILKGSLGLLYPLNCQVCRVAVEFGDGRPICLGCWAKIKRNLPPFCTKCGRSLPGLGGSVSICGNCQSSGYFFERTVAACLYEGVVKECIHLLKYGKKLCLINTLGELLVNFINGHFNLEGIELIVPVPLSSAKLRERGFNQAELLARQIEADSKIPVLTKNLKKIKSSPSQTTLSRKERLTNLKGAFKVCKPNIFRGRWILLVDDVFTTGATVNECSKTLLKAGAKRIDVLTLARGA